jgi:hypothetical protein
MFGVAGDAAIKVDPNDAVTTALTIGEGFETALTARQLGFGPVWALGSAGAVGSFPVLPGVECLTILGEHDANGANRRNADQCARRWHEAGREIVIVEPIGGKDLNDAIRGAA